MFAASSLFNSNRTEFVDSWNSSANALRYDLVSGLEKSFFKSLSLVFDEIIDDKILFVLKCLNGFARSLP